MFTRRNVSRYRFEKFVEFKVELVENIKSRNIGRCVRVRANNADDIDNNVIAQSNSASYRLLTKTPGTLRNFTRFARVLFRARYFA